MKIYHHLKFYLTFALTVIAILIKAQYITVDTENYTQQQLVKNVFFGTQSAGCISVENMTIKGYDFLSGPKSWGYFNRNGSTFEMDEGIILSTGNALDARGPNNSLQSVTGTGWSGDDDLERALGISNTANATILEFDFTVTNDFITKISFDYLFASEQYLRNIDSGSCNYTDGFAFLIKEDGSTDYRNLAVIPGTNIPIKSDNVRGGGEKCSAKNEEYFGHYNYNSPTNFNGQTKILKAVTDIIPHRKYHLKLVIADQGNGLYDSGVFLRAGSFVGTKDLGPDLLISSNNALCEDAPKILDATTSGATSYQWYKGGVLLPTENRAKLTLPGVPSSSGNYEVEIGLAGCSLKGSINVEVQPRAIISSQTFSFCDASLTGSVPVNFTALKSAVIQNYNSSYIIKYYLSKNDAENGSSAFLNDGWLLTADTKIFVRVESGFACAPVIGELMLLFDGKIPLLTPTLEDSVCDSENLGEVSVNLDSYKQKFTSDSAVRQTFFNSVNDAKKNINPISSAQIISEPAKTFGIRFESPTACTNVGEIIITKKSAAKSTVLKNQKICRNATAVLDAGAGFDYYRWSTGKEGTNSSTLPNVPIGEYWVELSSKGCVYRQKVSVSAAEQPSITHVEITGNTAAVYVAGGDPPYQYSLDNITFQNSNIFLKVPLGPHTVYVRDAQKCETLEKEFLLLNLINVISPNGDGKNDVLDYSDLQIKKEVKISIFDRYGSKVFTAENNIFLWDGKINGRPLPSGTYWYIINWIEPETEIPVSYKGWILLKNRN